MSFWKYYSKQVKLYENFRALDTASNSISRNTFFQLLSKGKYLPLKMVAEDTPTYQLYRLDPNADEGIFSQIRSIGKVQSKYFFMEGKALPDFSFTDLTGRVYNRENTVGKVVVLKCWFIKCQACVEEMPYVNEVFDRYKHRNDIVFISLAFDEADQLKAFLKRTRFYYAVVANQEKYLMEDVGIEAYPSHIIINKQGKVVRVVESAKAMAYLLEKEIAK